MKNYEKHQKMKPKTSKSTSMLHGLGNEHMSGAADLIRGGQEGFGHVEPKA